MITTTLDKAFEEVQKLVEKFENGKDHYMSPFYSESEARQDFIDNFFIALGWDVTHKHQHNPYQQEVKIERSQKQQNESARKRADYAFFCTPNFKDVHFFVEAKKPSVLLHNAPAHYFQTIKYGWNAGCPISILTDFEEFVIIDCRSKPNLKYALNGKHKSYRYTDYADKEKFAEIYFLFSREAVANKSIENYAKSLPKASGRVTQKLLFKGGYQAIDDSFLEYIDTIRETIAKAFKKADEDLDSEQLTEATQRTVDRLVFTRFLEDKYIEPINHINEWAANIHPWKAFITDCKALNVKYNGVVFKPLFIDKENFLGADEKLFGEICNELSSDNSPYDFNYIPIHILGSIYERFLGKIVVATAKRVTIEEKPEVRKAGGVFYTPKYIVDYIVANTVGKLIAGKTPAKIAELTFADIACGSGSFLIGVYDYLLQYHKDYYTKYPTVAKADGCVEIDGVMALSIKQKQNILLNNIYGVDIDSQAVEVTQLSLFLKMLEDETLTSTMAQAKQTSLYAKVLPDLTKNIVCGNSLIGTDILQGQLFDMAEERKLNPMDYDTTFPKVFRNGGFDAVVGNPPYLSTKRGFAENNIENLYLKNNFINAVKQFDAYTIFIEKVSQILIKNGFWGYIIPKPFLSNENMDVPRNSILKNGSINYIADFGTPFKDASVEAIVIIQKMLNDTKNEINIDFYEKEIKLRSNLISQKIFTETPNNTFTLNTNSKIEKLLFKIEKNKKNLSEINQYLIRGIEAGKNDSSISNKKEAGLKKLLRGLDVSRYDIKFSEYYINVDYKNTVKFKKEKIYEIQKKILIRRVGNEIQATIDYNSFWNLNTIYNLKSEKNNDEFLVAIINSKLISFWFKLRYILDDKLFPYVRISQLEKIPIPNLDLSKEEDKIPHDQIVSLVEQMLESKQKLQSVTMEKDKDYYEKKCTTLDRQIDNLVYKLYDLTEEEIRIVEGV